MLPVMSPLDLGNQRIANLASPSASTDAVNKAYVDLAIQGLDWKASVRAASTGNVTLATPGSTLDGVTLVSGDRVLLKDQTTGSENGIYIFNGAATLATRATDADTSGKVTPGLAVSVEEGSVNADKNYLLTTDGPVTLDTTLLAFSVLGGGSTTYTGGTGVTVTGSVIAVDTNVVSRKFAANVGDGSSTSIVVTHNLGTRDISAKVYTNASPYDEVLVEIQHTTTNTATIIFGTAPASNAYRVVVIG